jgi:hypothetical protein
MHGSSFRGAAAKRRRTRNPATTARGAAMTAELSVDQPYLRWLVLHRSNIQNLLLELHLFLQEQRKALDADADLRSIFGLLVGSAFSLWQAVYLADSSRDWKNILDDADRFLDTLIRDNTILFRDDKNAWSIGYYLNNGRYRLYRILEKMPDEQLRTLIAQIKSTGGVDEVSARNAWQLSYEAARLAFDLVKSRSVKSAVTT